ncbi:MAG: hypothetical protein R2795_02740 [Saprospiraceae bacterium]
MGLASPLVAQRRFRLPEAMKEVSGLYVEQPNRLWWHNDSGHAPVLYLTDGEGRLQAAYPLACNSIDWEDISHDEQGNIYIGDIGDNREVRDTLTIYRFQPANGQLDSLRYQYEGGQHFNSEAFFWHNDSLHIFTKSRIRRAKLPVYHFVVPAQMGVHTATLRDSFALRKRVVTAAAIDEDTGKVGLLAYYFTRRLGFIPYSAANVYWFDDYSGNRFLRGQMTSKRISCVVATQYESLDIWEGDEWMVASEQTLFIKAKAKKVKAKRRPVPMR